MRGHGRSETSALGHAVRLPKVQLETGRATNCIIPATKKLHRAIFAPPAKHKVVLVHTRDESIWLAVVRADAKVWTVGSACARPWWQFRFPTLNRIPVIMPVESHLAAIKTEMP